MGKGDRRSKRGKIAKGTFGKYRSAKPNKVVVTKPKEEEKVETETEA